MDLKRHRCGHLSQDLFFLCASALLSASSRDALVRLKKASRSVRPAGVDSEDADVEDSVSGGGGVRASLACDVDLGFSKS